MNVKIGGIKVHTLDDIRGIDNAVQLTKWLPGLQDDLKYLENEYRRIAKDPTRLCILVCDKLKYALFVNDVTDGSWARLSEKDEDEE